MNKVILMGNLTRDPEISYSSGDNSMAIARFSLAVNRRFSRQGNDEVDFFNCTAFRQQAEFVEKYFKKGSRMLVSGRIQNDNYTNRNGEKVYSVSIIVEEVEFGSRKNDDNSFNTNSQGFDAGSAPQPTQASNDENFMDIPNGIEEGLPFN